MRSPAPRSPTAHAPSPLPLGSAHRLAALALGLALPFSTLAPAAADPRAWTDPPAKPAAAAPAEPKAASGPSDAQAADGRKGGEAGKDEKAAAVPERAAAPVATPAARAASEPVRTRPVPTAAARRPHHADTPAALSSAMPAEAGARPAAARALAAEYLATVSASGEAMVGAAPHFYAARIRFYGRPTTLAALMSEKRGFARRWPERRYAPRAIRTACDGQTCTVRAVVDFRAANPARGAVSRGSSELVLEVSFAGARPVIVAESGRVLRRGSQDAAGPAVAPALAPAGGRA